MATKFLETSDATFTVQTTGVIPNLWAVAVGTPAVATDFVHGTHIKSTKFEVNAVSHLAVASGTIAQTGNRISFYMYLNALPAGDVQILNMMNTASTRVRLQITSGGVLQLMTAGSVQIGSNGGTLVTGKWYRICLSYTITSNTVNSFKVFLDGVQSIAGTNATLIDGTVNLFRIGNVNGDSAMDLRTSDHYVDDSTAITDPGNIWVTAKRPVASGTVTGFTTQVGIGGSGYGTGHSPQVNERPLSATNGWSMIGAGSAVTEEYTIEGKTVGDINIGAGTIVDFTGWVDAKALANETASIVVAGVNSNIALTSTETLFTKAAGSTTYPAGGTDIGIITTTDLTTVSLYECGVMVAFIPSSTNNLTLLGVG